MRVISESIFDGVKVPVCRIGTRIVIPADIAAECMKIKGGLPELIHDINSANGNMNDFLRMQNSGENEEFKAPMLTPEGALVAAMKEQTKSAINFFHWFHRYAYRVRNDERKQITELNYLTESQEKEIQNYLNSIVERLIPNLNNVLTNALSKEIAFLAESIRNEKVERPINIIAYPKEYLQSFCKNTKALTENDLYETVWPLANALGDNSPNKRGTIEKVLLRMEKEGYISLNGIEETSKRIQCVLESQECFRIFKKTVRSMLAEATGNME